jgi:2-iminoacetate synthase
MYNPKSLDANEFIDDGEITASINDAKKLVHRESEIERILTKAKACQGLSHREAAVLLEVDDEKTLERIYEIAREVKEKIYGRRIVLFAPCCSSQLCTMMFKSQLQSR